jgi:hypothetical protein
MDCAVDLQQFSGLIWVNLGEISPLIYTVFLREGQAFGSSIRGKTAYKASHKLSIRSIDKHNMFCSTKRLQQYWSSSTILCLQLWDGDRDNNTRPGNIRVPEHDDSLSASPYALYQKPECCHIDTRWHLHDLLSSCFESLSRNLIV